MWDISSGSQHVLYSYSERLKCFIGDEKRVIDVFFKFSLLVRKTPVNVFFLFSIRTF